MGLLDDAIREHLELKRRRGADPAEVEKQEREALGPIGALQEPAAPALPVQDEPLDDDPLEDDAIGYDDGRVPLDDERDALAGHDAYDDDPDPFEDAHTALHDDPLPPEPRAPAGAVRADFDDPPARDSEPPPRENPLPRADPPPAVSQPTEQYSVDDLEELRREDEGEPDRPEGEGEDVLDETPDFLQEAPEHDRLWFEQRPPRDFDF
ncbi:MAG TPA: hypothetical protein VF587_19870 [Solirubrobacteraceae bacterium]|jgi:hypothetical protein